jgi:Flp pilus assembly protein CpaB
MRSRRRVLLRRSRLRRLVRHPLVYWTVAIALTFVTVSAVQRSTTSADAARRRWGEGHAVVVATRELAIGALIGPDDVTIASWPDAVVPAGALRDPPIGRTVTATIEPGEAVGGARVAPEGLHGIAALVPRGSRAMAIPIGGAAPAVAPGDTVDLIAGFDAVATGNGEAPSFPVATGALVLGVDEHQVVVAVMEADVPRVAFAITAGTVVVAVRGN